MANKHNLEMIFRNESGSLIQLIINEPKADLSLAQVQSAANTIISNNIFTSRGGNLLELTDARIRVVEVTTLE